MASIREKFISILSENLNLGGTFLITTVLQNLHEKESFDENFADLQKIFVGHLQSWFYWDLQA